MELIQHFLTNAMQSDFFAGGLALGAFGIAAAALRVSLTRLHRLIMRRIWVSLTFDNRSNSYRYFCIWMEDTGVLRHAKQARVTDASWSRGHGGYAPAPGRHWFIRNGQLCHLQREISDRTKIGAGHQQRPMETLTVTVLLGRISTITGWINEGREAFKTKDRIGPALYLLKGDYWDSIGDIPRRSLDTILVDDDRTERMLADMRWFYGAKDWYSQRGVPWRRGYLLCGPPGTGKSSLIRAIASEMELDIASLDVGRAGLTDDDLREAMMSTPEKSLIAIEDIDAVFVKRREGDKRASISFSGLLNAIDGVAAQEGRALIMTTNHKNQLDPALIRPGRADMHIELGSVNANTAAHLFERFFPDEPLYCEYFRVALGDRMVIPSAVQGWLLSQNTDIAKAATAEGLLRNVDKVSAA